MPVPTKYDLLNIKVKVEGFKKKLNADGTPKSKHGDIDWESKTKQLLRNSTRKEWMFAPNKLAFLLESRIPDMNPNTRTKWLQKCSKCGETYKETLVQVDHIVGENTYTEISESVNYVKNILNVGWDGMQILCSDPKLSNNCHGVKTECEAKGYDWTTEEGWGMGVKSKRFNEVMKNECKTAAKQKSWLLGQGVDIVNIKTNQEQRRQMIRDIIFK